MTDEDLLRRLQDCERQFEKQRRFAENYGADSKTITQFYQRLQEQVLAPSNAKALEMLGAELKKTKPMTSIELQAELDAAIKTMLVQA